MNSGWMARKDAIKRPTGGGQHLLPIRIRISPAFSFGNRSECRGQPIRENIVAGSSRRPLYQMRLRLQGDGKSPAVRHGIREGDCDTSTARVSGTPSACFCKYRNAESRTASSRAVSCRRTSSGAVELYGCPSAEPNFARPCVFLNAAAVCTRARRRR